MSRRPPSSPLDRAAAASDVYKRQGINAPTDPEAAARMRGSGNINWSDYDRDGDLDLLLGGGPGASSGHLFRNTIGQSNDWLQVRVVGDGATVNRDAIGARVTLRWAADGAATIGSPAGEQITRQVKAGRGTYNSTDTRVLHFGLGARDNRRLGIRDAHAVEETRIDAHAVARFRFACKRPGRIVGARCDHADNRQAVLRGEIEVALVVAGHTHDRTRAVFAEHEVGHPHGHGLACEGIHRRASGIEAFFLDFAAHTRSFILTAELRDLRTEGRWVCRLGGELFDQRMLWREQHEHRAEDGVDAGREAVSYTHLTLPTSDLV